MKTNNSYLKHQMKILAQSEGVTVEAREKAYKYVENYIAKLMNENEELYNSVKTLRKDCNEACEFANALQIENDALKADIVHKDATIEQLMKDSAKPKTPVKKKTAAKKTVKK